MNTASSKLYGWFPKLKGKPGFLRITSPIDGFYNCVAWAMDDDSQWWEPLAGNYPLTYWPIERAGYSIAAYVSMFESQGYAVCGDGAHEPGVKKIAIYKTKVDELFAHVAKQALNEGWLSKCGGESDIWHKTPDSLEGETYGVVWGFMSKITSEEEVVPTEPASGKPKLKRVK